MQHSKQKSVWKAFDNEDHYVVEKEKQEAIYEERLRKKPGWEGAKFEVFAAKFLQQVNRLDTQCKREEFGKDLESLAKESYAHATNREFTADQRLKWARIEAYISQVLNTLIKTYDNIVIEKQTS